MDDMDLTVPPRREHASSGADDVTMPGKRDRKPDGRFTVGDLIMRRYKVLAELGQGGMGVVYKCFDETAGIEVALKALPPELSHNTLEMEDIKDNFQLVHNLHHPNIASSNNLEKDNSNGNYYLIMECCEGEDLRRWLRRKRKEGKITLEDVLPIVKQVADALDYAHEMKIIHRDIKPGNIMIDQFGKIKVLDFGLAAQIHTSMTRVSMAYYGTSGTGPYMAPEQWRGRAQGAAADQYALAVMAYEMLTGHTPFESSDAAVLREAVLNDIPQEIADIPKTAQEAVKRAMSKEPAERFENCSDFAAALGGKKVKAAKIQKKGGSGKWIAAVILLAVLGAGGAGYYFFNKQQKEEQARLVEARRIAAAQAEKERQAKLAAEQAEKERQAKLAAAQAEKERQAKRTEEQLDGENSALKVELTEKLAEIDRKNYDTAQTFGEKTREMKTAFAVAQEAKLLSTANREYKKAQKLADWILTNGELREEAKKLKLQAENNKGAAEKYEPQTYAKELYSSAGNTYNQAIKLYNEIKFAEAKTLFAESAKGFKKAENTAFDNKLQCLKDKAKEYEKESKWDKLKDLAEEIRPLNSALAKQFTTTAENELNKIAVEKELSAARKAKETGNWQSVCDHAVAALKIDSSNSEAQSLKQEAMFIVCIQKAQSNLKAERWEKAFEFADQALAIRPDNEEARKIREQAEENMISSDDALKRYLLRLCKNNTKPDYSQRNAIKRLTKFDFSDFSLKSYSSFDGYTLLDDAIDVGASLSAVRYLVEQKFQPVEHIGKYTYRTPLCTAVWRNNLPVLKYLISRGASSNPRFNVDYGLPPLFYAKNLEMTKLLVAAGADVMWKDKKGETLADKKDFDVVYFLIGKGAQLTDPQDLYRKAACHGELDFLKKNAGKASEVKDLMVAAVSSGNMELIKYLETLGLSFTAKNDTTVLHAACGKKGTLEIFRYVWSKSGLSLESKNKGGETPLMRATISGNIKLFDFLIKNGADMTATDKYGKTLLCLAIDAGNFEMVRALVKKGANVNAKCHPGWTLVYRAYNNRNQKILRYLCENGADLNASNDGRGWATALHDAVRDEDITWIRILLELGADPMKADEENRTPMSLCNNNEIRTLLTKNVLTKHGGQLVANNSKELMALLNAGGENTVIKLKNGTYNIKKSIYIERTIKLVGESRSGTCITFSGDSHIAIYNTDGGIVELENLTINGSPNTHSNTIYLYKKAKCIIRNCRISNNARSRSAISTYDGVRLLLKDSELISHKGDDTLSVSNKSRVKLMNCSFVFRGGSDEKSEALQISSNSSVYAVGCKFFSSQSDSVYVMEGTAYFNDCQFTAPADEYGIDNGNSGAFAYSYNCSYVECQGLAKKDSNVSKANVIPSDSVFFK